MGRDRGVGEVVGVLRRLPEPAGNGQQAAGPAARPFSPPRPRDGLALEYPLRPGFLAQVVVPPDLTVDEARRMGAFLLTLSPDYKPA